jgi:hypothetical protein
LKIKFKERHFDIIDVIEAQSQATLNTITEYDFQDAFKSGINGGNGAFAWKGTTLRVMVASRPKVSVWPECNNSPRDYRYQWYL